MPASRPRPPYDPALAEVLDALAPMMPPSLTLDRIPAARQAPLPEPVEDVLVRAGVTRTDHALAGCGGGEIEVSVLRRDDADPAQHAPCVYHVHGGGMVFGDRFVGLQQFLPWVVELGATVVTVEYRLAPEHPDPVPVEDCYAGLLWTVEHAAQLGIDPARVVVAGGSAGGGLAAGVALLARDRGGPELAAQLLIYPMLDDRGSTASAHQYDGVGIWDRASNETGWTALLGERRGTDDVSIYAAPARATDLSGLPPAYVDCGSAEVFRDEDVAYASALWAAGVQAELHVWPGGFHGCDVMAPHTDLARAMTASRHAWLAARLQTQV
ncbi:alpha/beta hydrolase [Nocardioides sp. QY071]|uniref:alpha/beta hydrolase n=1 Tax=Nocardioides sp. QY071 TaxID=3044187 RepID=UPI00249BD775|nr:alpha/beta hydrolase [Nocardioides sp. QY071]WGY00404.1 alpha/beta hydrolase [Nocardioides sp. QY071]